MRQRRRLRRHQCRRLRRHQCRRAAAMQARPEWGRLPALSDAAQLRDLACAPSPFCVPAPPDWNNECCGVKRNETGMADMTIRCAAALPPPPALLRQPPLLMGGALRSSPSLPPLHVTEHKQATPPPPPLPPSPAPPAASTLAPSPLGPCHTPPRPPSGPARAGFLPTAPMRETTVRRASTGCTCSTRPTAGCVDPRAWPLQRDACLPLCQTLPCCCWQWAASPPNPGPPFPTHLRLCLTPPRQIRNVVIENADMGIVMDGTSFNTIQNVTFTSSQPTHPDHSYYGGKGIWLKVGCGSG